MTTFWGDFQSDWVPILYLNTIRMTSSAEKISLSLSHLAPEILGPTIGLMFHQNVLFNILGILYQFSPWYSIQVTSFSLILNLFDPSFSKNFRSDWVQFLFTCCEPSYRKKILCLCQTSWLKNRHFIVVIMSIYNTWCQITQWWGLVMTASHHSQFWHANQASSHLIALLWLQTTLLVSPKCVEIAMNIFILVQVIIKHIVSCPCLSTLFMT